MEHDSNDTNINLQETLVELQDRLKKLGTVRDLLVQAQNDAKIQNEKWGSTLAVQSESVQTLISLLSRYDILFEEVSTEYSRLCTAVSHLKSQISESGFPDKINTVETNIVQKFTDLTNSGGPLDTLVTSRIKSEVSSLMAEGGPLQISTQSVQDTLSKKLEAKITGLNAALTIHRRLMVACLILVSLGVILTVAL